MKIPGVSCTVFAMILAEAVMSGSNSHSDRVKSSNHVTGSWLPGQLQACGLFTPHVPSPVEPPFRTGN